MDSKLNQSQKILCDLCSNALFFKKIDIPKNFDVDMVLNEAKYQTVYPIVSAALKNLSAKKEIRDRLLYRYIANNLKVNYNHTEIADLFSKNNVKYVFIKGIASAFYYNQPDLRTMGDVDILINRSDIHKADDLLKTLGYSTNADLSKKRGHTAYIREVDNTVSVCEVHFTINGIPDSLADVFDSYLETVFENAKDIVVANHNGLIPSDFHHGIILLLHTASHLTHEGIGLRHLCDWAVFVNSFSNDEFVRLFQKPLKEMCMWRFARILTLCCVKYLGIDKREWCGKADEELLDAMISDIINGGNFGFKDEDRYRQIKYISNHKTNVFSQLLSSINNKAKNKYGIVRKCKLFLPIGWMAIIFDYLFLLITRKRKLDTRKTINSAKHRQNIYYEFKLFKK